MIDQIKRPLVWLNLITGALFGFQAIMRFMYQNEPSWVAWVTLFTSVCFFGTGLGYLCRIQKQKRSHTASPKGAPEEPTS